MAAMGNRHKFASGLAFLALLVAGCGATGAGEGGAHPDYAKALAGSPPALAALHRQANQLLPGGADAYEGRIAALRGYPVVVNFWGSWCGACRLEFPTLQKISAKYGKRVAFLGVDSEDSENNASEFLEEDPVPYPSYTDPDKSVAESVGVRGFPDTAFYDRRGDFCYLKQGQYSDSGALEADLHRFALAGECESG
jgi:cytochrome c biogenesis protein CcmG/thiol:disulfide interchange protein DsbE